MQCTFFNILVLHNAMIKYYFMFESLRHLYFHTMHAATFCTHPFLFLKCSNFNTEYIQENLV
jgi:hypothetical protein